MNTRSGRSSFEVFDILEAALIVAYGGIIGVGIVAGLYYAGVWAIAITAVVAVVVAVVLLIGFLLNYFDIWTRY